MPGGRQTCVFLALITSCPEVVRLRWGSLVVRASLPFQRSDFVAESHAPTESYPVLTFQWTKRDLFRKYRRINHLPSILMSVVLVTNLLSKGN